MDAVSEETTATEGYAYARQILQAGIELTRYLRAKLPEHTRPSFWDQRHGQTVELSVCHQFDMVGVRPPSEKLLPRRKRVASTFQQQSKICRLIAAALFNRNELRTAAQRRNLERDSDRLMRFASRVRHHHVVDVTRWRREIERPTPSGWSELDPTSIRGDPTVCSQVN